MSAIPVTKWGIQFSPCRFPENGHSYAALSVIVRGSSCETILVRQSLTSTPMKDSRSGPARKPFRLSSRIVSRVRPQQFLKRCLDLVARPIEDATEGGSESSRHPLCPPYCANTNVNTCSARAATVHLTRDSVAGAAVQNNCPGLRWLSFDLPLRPTQAVDYLLENASFYPALRLLVDRMPELQIVEHEPPLHAGAHAVAHTVGDFVQAMLTIRRFLSSSTSGRVRRTPIRHRKHHPTKLCVSCLELSIPRVENT